MKNIKDYNLDELKEELKKIGEKTFRAEQIFKWIYESRVSSFDEMTNLSLELREKLKENYTIKQFNILKKQVASDGTKKYLFDVLDGNAIETVLWNIIMDIAFVFLPKLVVKWDVNFVHQRVFPLLETYLLEKLLNK